MDILGDVSVNVGLKLSAGIMTPIRETVYKKGFGPTVSQVHHHVLVPIGNLLRDAVANSIFHVLTDNSEGSRWIPVK